MRTLHGTDQVVAALGDELGVGGWHTVTQATIDAFADVTGDRQWIHVDRARAGDGPFGTTIAHGYLTLSLLPMLTSDIYELTGFAMRVNYGLDRVRFPSPVRSGSRVRARVVLAGLERTPRGLRITLRQTVEIEGAGAPGCVADAIVLLVPETGGA